MCEKENETNRDRETTKYVSPCGRMLGLKASEQRINVTRIVGKKNAGHLCGE
jgi:hypothetical protein